jgi:hypothetical protein
MAGTTAGFRPHRATPHGEPETAIHSPKSQSDVRVGSFAEMRARLRDFRFASVSGRGATVAGTAPAGPANLRFTSVAILWVRSAGRARWFVRPPDGGAATACSVF